MVNSWIIEFFASSDSYRFDFLEGDDNFGLPFDPNEQTGKIGTKKKKKLEMKAEKKALREVHICIALMQDYC